MYVTLALRKKQDITFKFKCDIPTLGHFETWHNGIMVQFCFDELIFSKNTKFEINI